MTPPLHSIISRLHLKQLRLLVALGEHGSLLKAAQQVALTQPGASKALQEIETTCCRQCFAGGACNAAVCLAADALMRHRFPRRCALRSANMPMRLLLEGEFRGSG